MTRNAAWWIIGVSSILLGITIAFAARFSPGSNAGFEDAASTIAFIGAAAIAIERVIEAFWTFFGGVAGSYWPLTAIHRQVQTLMTELDSSLEPFHEKAIARINELKQAGSRTQEELKRLENAPQDIERLKKRFDELRKLAPGNQRVQLLAAAASQNVMYLTEKYGDDLVELKDAAAVANSAIAGLQDFLATFKDNPGRRLISIYMGSILGLILAGIFGLGVFQATLGSVPYEKLSIILTGLIIGLGSNPTHEVIRVIQEFKESRKGQNTKQPDLP
jgi:hypothetical protein